MTCGGHVGLGTNDRHEEKKHVKAGGTKTLQEASLSSTLLKRNGNNANFDCAF
jgi:hypothetical protein